MKAIIAFALIVALGSASLLDGPAVTQETVESINNGNYGWKARMNSRFEKSTLRMAKHLCGVLPDKEPMPEDHLFENVAVPDSFDARAAWPQCPSIGHIRDQANCGSCWAFGGAEAWSDRICIDTNGQHTEPMSTADLLSCCGYTCGYGCEGGSLGGAWSYIKSTGLVTGEDYESKIWCANYQLKSCDHHIDGSKNPCPDTVPTPACPAKCNSSYAGVWANDKHKAVSIYAVNGEQNMMNEIYAHGPIEAAFTVYSDFLTYSEGVYTHVTGSYLGGHAIRILGWGEENGMKYWLVANSWNVHWGDQGYFKIKKGSNECGIESNGYAGRYIL